MKRKHLAFLLAAALTVTSVDGTAFMVNAADFTAESQEAEAQSDETSETVVAEEESEADFDAENAEIENGGLNSEVTEEADGDEITAENEDEISDEAAIADEDEVQVEGEEDFTSDVAGDEDDGIESVTVNTDGVKTTFIEKIETVNLKGLSLTVKYTDGTEESVEFGETDEATGTLGNTYTCYIDYGSTTGGFSRLDKGNYTIGIYRNGYELDNVSINIDVTDMWKLTDTFKEGTTNLDLKYGELQGFKFQPDKTSEYKLLRAYDPSLSGSIDAYFTLYELDDENNVVGEPEEQRLTGGIDIKLNLKQGKKYVFVFGTEEDNSIDVDFSRTPEAAGVEIIERTPAEDTLTFVKGIDADVSFAPEYVKANVYYDNEETTTLQYYKSDLPESDEYGRSLGWQLRKVNKADGTGENVDPYIDSLEAGSYELWIGYGVPDSKYNGSLKANSACWSTDAIKVEIKTPDTLENTIDLAADSDKTVTNTGDKMVFKFTPDTAARYKFELNSELYDGVLVDSEGNILEESSETYVMYGSLDAGKTYYLAGRFNKECENIQVSVSQAITPVKLTTKLLKKNQSYIEKVDTYGDIAMETVLTYIDENGDEKTRVIKPDEEIGGLPVKWVVSRVTDGQEETDPDEDESEEDSSFDLNNYDRLKAGTWKITPAIGRRSAYDWEDYALDGDGSANAKVPEVTCEGIEITVKSMASLENLDTLTLDKWTDVVSTKRHLYKFTAPEDGIYEVAIDGDADYDIYIDSDSDNYADANLKADESCIIAVTAPNDSRIKIEKYVEPEKQEKKEYNMEVGFKENLPLYLYNSFVFRFKPAVAGYYQLKFDSNSIDRMGYHVTLKCDGKDVEDFSNSQPVRMEAGKTYEYVVSDFEYMESISVSFEQVIINKVTKMELVPATETEFGVAQTPMEAYEIKVTYADGTVRTYDEYGFRDEFDNYISMYQSETKTTATGKEITVELYYWLPGSCDDIIVSTVTIKAKDTSSYAEIRLGDTKQPLKDANGKDDIYYRFTAPKTGRYLVQLDAGCDFYYTGMQVLICNKSEDGEYSWDGVENLLDTYAGYCVYELKEDQTYLIRATELQGHSSLTLTVKDAKKLKSVEVEAQPTKNYVYRGFEEQPELDGMKVKAVYDDGSDETVEYGKYDSMGNQSEIYSTSVLNASKVRVYVKFGQYRTYVDLDLRDTDSDTMQKAEIGQETKVDMKGDNVAFVKFVPAEDGYYGLHVNNTLGAECIYRARDQKELNKEKAYLEAGETYYIRLVSYATPVVKLMKGACNWVETEKPATCTEEGENSRTCTTHGVVEKDTTKAYGHKFSDWKVTKQPTCGAAGTEERVCSRCKTVEKRAIAATGKHKYGSWKTTKEATVLTAGQQERSCSVCGKKETSATAKLKATIEMNVSGTVPLKRKQTFNVKVTTGKGDKVVSWKSSNKKVVSVSKNGKIKGIKAGKTATITVQLQSGLKASFKVKVQKKAVATKSIKVTNAATGKNIGKKLTMKAKGTLKLAAAVSPVTSKQKVTYSSSNKKIATVTSKGVIKAKKKGKVTITVKSGKKSYKIKITVK